MLSQKLSRIGFKMADLEEYEQMKKNRGDKAMDATPEAKPSSSVKTPTARKTLANVTTSNRSTPGGGVSFRSSTPEHSS